MMIELLPKIPAYQVARGLGISPPLPINLTLGLTFRCNARCATCRVYERKAENELTPEEWRRIFKSLGKAPYWITFTGGEPFLYRDLVEVYYDLCEICRPAIVNIPTNGLLTERIVEWVWEMAKLSPMTKLVVNVSLDHCVAELNDEIRGVKRYYERAAKTLKGLQSLKADNLTVGLHTVISKHNVDVFPSICEVLPRLLRDKSHYITEIAEERVELGNLGLPITPSYQEYKTAIDSLLAHMNGRSIIGAFRKRYYGNVLRWLKGKRTIPCYAGYASCQITPDAYVWFCCIKAVPVGNLRESNYDFKAIWHGDVAHDLRVMTKDVKCSCPMANVFYTNALMHPPTLAKVIGGLV